MARPERNDIDYFPHKIDHGRKMFYLEDKYGNDGYATWFKILEELGKTDYHYLDLSEDTTMMYLASKCKVEIPVMKDIIVDLVKFKEFNKYVWEKHEILWGQPFIDSIRDAYSHRKNNCMTLRNLSKLLELNIPETQFTEVNQGINSVKQGVNPQSIVKDSKEEYSIVTKEPDNTSIKELFSKTVAFYNAQLDNDIYKQDPAFKSFHTLVAYLLDKEPKRNPIGSPVWHILKIRHQLKFEDFKKLREKSKAKGTSPFHYIEKWTNKPQYTKGQMSIYSTLNQWIDNEPVRR